MRHENYSQRHKWPATWGYLVYEYNKVRHFVVILCVPMEFPIKFDTYSQDGPLYILRGSML